MVQLMSSAQRVIYVRSGEGKRLGRGSTASFCFLRIPFQGHVWVSWWWWWHGQEPRGGIGRLISNESWRIPGRNPGKGSYDDT